MYAHILLTSACILIVLVFVFCVLVVFVFFNFMCPFVARASLVECCVAHATARAAASARS